MSVLDRKMFKRVAKLKHGGNPNIDHYTGAPVNTNVVGPVSVPGGLNQVDTSIYQTDMAPASGITAASNLGNVLID